jgi:hypoxanthine phosphoribosyltransferase
MKTLFTAEQIKQRVHELGEQIGADYAGKELTAVCVLKGSCVFFSDLVRAIPTDVRFEFISVSSYADTASSGEVKLLHDLSCAAAGRDLLIVEDIIDTGATLCYLKKLLEARGPSSVKICALLDKPSKRTTPLQADYAGFTVPDVFVVGYGLDCNQKYRNLVDIKIL